MTQTREGIDYTVYVIKSTRSAPFIRWKGTVKKYPFSIYPVNTLRDLGIESIKTSHYLLLDIDVLPSINLYNSILLNKGILARDPHNVLLFQLFQFNKAIIKQQRTMPQFKKLYLLSQPSTVDGTAFRWIRRSSFVICARRSLSSSSTVIRCHPPQPLTHSTSWKCLSGWRTIERQRITCPFRRRRSRIPSHLTQHVDMAFSDDPLSHHSSIPSSSTMDTTRSASTNDSTWRVLSFSFPHLQTLPSMFSLSALVLICPILAASVLTAIERTRTTRWWFSTKWWTSCHMFSAFRRV